MPTVTEKGAIPRRRRGRYPCGFRRDVAALVLDQDRSAADVAEELDLVSKTVARWVNQERIDRGEQEGLTSEERARLVELERENKRLRQERDLLKKAEAFWVRQSAP
jgi:transposase